MCVGVCVCVCVQRPALPVVQLSASRPVGVERKRVGLLRLVEAEAVVPAVPGAVQLLQQEDYSVMDHAQHPQPIHTCGGALGNVVL